MSLVDAFLYLGVQTMRYENCERHRLLPDPPFQSFFSIAIVIF